MGFPGETGKMAEIVGRDCFLNSLNNPQLRIKILQLQPANLDEALNHLCRLEAYESLVSEGAQVTVKLLATNCIFALPQCHYNLYKRLFVLRYLFGDAY